MAIVLAGCNDSPEEDGSAAPLFPADSPADTVGETSGPTATEPTVDPTHADPTTTPDTTSPSALATPSPTTTPTDDFAVPDEITPEYIERVLNELERLGADIVVDVLEMPVRERAVDLPERIEHRLDQLYSGRNLEIGRRVLLDLLRNQESRRELVPASDYGQVDYQVQDVLGIEPCVGVRVVRDLSRTDANPDRDRTTTAFVFLKSAESENPTGWKTTNLVLNDAPPGSQSELELAEVTFNDIANEIAVCQ